MKFDGQWYYSEYTDAGKSILAFALTAFSTGKMVIIQYPIDSYKQKVVGEEIFKWIGGIYPRE